jgi:Cof subfamily protein (haloacid dehalogenase superfamily)
MDHTLLTEDGEIPPRFDDYVFKLEKRGVDFVIASGRPLCTLYAMFSTMKRTLIFIADNGGLISYKGDIVFKSLMKPEDYRPMIRFAHEETDGVPILCGLESGFIDKKDAAYAKRLKPFYSKMALVENLEQASPPACKFTIYFPRKNSKEYYETLFKPRYGGAFSVTVGDAIWIDIMNPGINKGKALRFLAEQLNVKPEHMMAFGDTYNDIEMLQSVQHSYIVKNASEDMRRYAAFIADSNDNFGVLKVLDSVIAEREALLHTGAGN